MANATSDNKSKDANYVLGQDKAFLDSLSHRTANNSADFLLPQLSEDTHLLDVGCGPGSITASFASYCKHGRVVGVDSSAEAISAAQGAHPDSPVEFRQASVYDLPFDDASFDVVFSHQVFQYLARPKDALAEISRLLKPGGLVALLCGCGPDALFEPKHPGLALLLDKTWRSLSATGSDPSIGRTMSILMREVGFFNMELSASIHTIATVHSKGVFADVWEKRLAGSSTLDTWSKHNLLQEGDIQLMIDGLEALTKDPDGFILFPAISVLGQKQ